MPSLPDYHEFSGRHRETGTVHNALAYQGVKAPHTGKPYSEALLLGVSGGIAFGYFTFDYQNYDPILALLTRNTFDPLETMLERLGIAQDIRQTSNPRTSEDNLCEALENGRPALVWADVFSLPYNALPYSEKEYDMQPVLVFGWENGQVWIADRSGQPLQLPAEIMTNARARVKKDKFRVVTLGSPDERKLPAAVQQGLWQCIRLYKEKPPKGARDNFGFAALEKWANMLTNTRNPQSWERFFPSGARLYAALAGNVVLPGAYGWIRTWGTRPDADRSTFADFLEEAAAILERPGLKEAAAIFRQVGGLWIELASALLPEDLPLLGETRRLKELRHALFIEQGQAALDEIRAINERLGDLRKAAESEFPLDDQQAARFREGLSERVRSIRACEQEAVQAMQDGLS
jgi:hypothetical protein